MDSTVTLVRRLQPYGLLKGDHHKDPNVRRILNSCLEPSTLTALDDYTCEMYSLNLHYASFRKYKRSIDNDRLFSTRILEHPTFSRALHRVRNDRASLGPLTMIRPDVLDDVIWNPSTATGFSYSGLKRDKYPLTRKNAIHALCGYAKYRSRCRFVLDKAFARSQLALRAQPKIRYAWGRAFLHILLEGCIAQPIIEQLLKVDHPIFIAKDIDKDMPAAIHKLLVEGVTAYCLDFSGFDSSICSELISTAWDIIYDMFIIRDQVDQLLNDLCRTLFCNVPLLHDRRTPTHY